MSEQFAANKSLFDAANIVRLQAIVDREIRRQRGSDESVYHAALDNRQPCSIPSSNPDPISPPFSCSRLIYCKGWRTAQHWGEKA